MTGDHVVVSIDGKPVRVFRGLRVMHALIACDQALYNAVRDGRAHVEDERGCRVGMEGALTPGARFFVRFDSRETGGERTRRETE
ncbi:MAG: hypothetical protein ABFD98_16115 [Syntrophobacteraceae bacterium]|nr:hypothetical protein [Desulfobacteraceae bacterium]